MRNSILMAILGDCMGVPYEFPNKLVEIDNPDDYLSSYKRKIGGRYYPTVVDCKAGDYSDDTQMLLMTLRSLGYDNYENAMVAELKAFLSYECGAGRATRASCKSLEKGVYAWDGVSDYYDFGGNGVVMRILPHAFENEDIDTILRHSFYNGILTHGSPVALVGSQLYVYYIWCKIHKKEFDIEGSRDIWGKLYKCEQATICLWYSAITYKERYEKEWADTVDKMINLYKNVPREFSKVIETIPVCGKEKGAGTWCAIASIILSECDNIEPMQLMKMVATLKGADTDTFACILGGILGVDFEPPADLVSQITDIDYILEEIEHFEKFAGTRYCGDIITVKNLKNKLRKLEIGGSLNVTPFGNITLDSIIKLKNLGDSFESYKYVFKTELGQVLTALQYRRVSK